MRDETYYTVLNVKETASASEIKTAYRDLIRQVHPDTITNHAPYLRKIAEDKAKEVTRAYSVLSNPSKRRNYDRQLLEYRLQTMAQAPPAPQSAPSQTASAAPFGSCNKCGTSLYASGYCPKCSKFAAPPGTRAASPRRPKAVRWLGYNWAPLMRWASEHPIIALAPPVVLVLVVAAALSMPPHDFFQALAKYGHINDTSQADLNCPSSQRVEVNGRFVCHQVPVQLSQPSTASAVATPATAGFVDSEKASQSKATVSVSGTYLGTVHNKTADVSSTVAVVLRQSKTGELQGCMQIKSPLYASGTVQGTVRGTYVNFVVADITLHGNALKDAITGAYIVSRKNGQQLGDFRVERRKEGDLPYYCNGGTVTEVQPEVNAAHQPQISAVLPEVKITQHPEVIVVLPEKPKLRVAYAIVTADHAAIEKRCAFLPTDNYRRCNWKPETIARVRRFDRLTILSPLTRAKDGEDIYKVRTAQGWKGWINSNFVDIQQ